MNSRHIILYLIFSVTLIGFAVFYSFFTSSFWGNRLGEFLFLELHFNPAAILVLENAKKDWQSHFLLGRLYFVNGELEKSINSYSTSIELKPDYKESYYGRGLSYGFMGEDYLVQAQNDFEKYIILEENEFKKTGRRAYGAWAGYNDLAWIHFLKGDFATQEKVARQGLEISSGNAWLQNILGVALLAQEKCEEAKGHLEIAKELADNKTAEEFGEAYSGDRPSFWKTGLDNMKEVIGENIKLCEKN